MKKLIEYLRRYTVRQKISLFLEEYIWPLFKIVPGYEGMFLRHIMLKFICAKVGRLGLVYRGVDLVHSFNLRLDDEVTINMGGHIDSRGGVRIGSHCLIGPNVIITSSNHIIDNISQPMSQHPYTGSAVIIENDVWIGAGVIITPGVTLRVGSVIAAGSVVTKDTEPYSVFAGVPAKFIRRRKVKSPIEEINTDK